MKIALLISGGVDSSVALFRLREQGYTDITAFYLKIWLEDELSYLGRCPWEEDLEYAREVCERASVPLRVASLQREYYDRVVEYVLRELRSGTTPSPDIFCNQRIKFGAFLEAHDVGFDRIATGHYALTEERGGKTILKRGHDRVKDQTYFLSHLRQEQVARALFPVGALPKAHVRALARDLELPNRERKDSQGICFLGRVKYPDFVRHYLGEQVGPIVEKETGRTLGEHRGYWFHTIGQRQGLGLPGGPWYVVEKDIARNIIYVTQSARLGEAARRTFEVTRLHWIAGPPEGHHSSAGMRLETKIRHGPEVRPATITWLEADRLRVDLDVPDPGIAGGQVAVFYDSEVCLGGGTIAP